MNTVGWTKSGRAIVEMSRTEWMGFMRGHYVDRFDELGTLVKAYRTGNKMSLRAFGKVSRVSASTVSRVERGEQPDLTTALRLAKAIGK